MKLLITGATGFLGAALCRRMAGEGHDVSVLVRRSSTLERLSQLPVSPVYGDITDESSVAAAVAGHECVVHAAADVNYWRRDVAGQWKVNVDGTAQVARQCRLLGVRRLVHVSSVAAVGIPEDPRSPADETFRFNLDNVDLPYHKSKHRAEEMVLAEVERGLDAVIVNPASISGPGRLTGLLKNVRRAPIVPVFAGGNSSAHVEDIVAGIAAAITQGRTGERYILGGENLTFREMAETAAAALGLQRLYVPIPWAVTRVAAALLEPWARWRDRRPRFAYMVHYCASRHMYYDSAKARRELQYRPRPFRDIVEEALGACGAHPSLAAAAGGERNV